MVYAIPICLIVLSLVLSFLASFFQKKEKLSVFVTLRGATVVSIAITAITTQNLIGYDALNGTTTFIIIALMIQIFSIILESLPTKSGLFDTIFSISNALSSLMLALAGFFLIPASAYGLPIGFAVGIVVSIMIALALRKFDLKTDLAKYVDLSFACALLGQIVIVILKTISAQTIIFTIAGIIYFASVVMKNFVNKESQKFAIAKNLTYFISLVLFTVSLFVVLF